MTSNILFFILLGGTIRLYHSLAQTKWKLTTGELLLLCIFSAFTSLVYTIQTGDLNLFSFGSSFLAVILFMSVVFLAKYILPRINEIQILIWVMLYWYIRLSLGSEIATSRYIDAVIADIILILCTIATLTISVLHVQLGNRSRLVLYIWFMAISTSVLYFALPDFSQIFINVFTTSETYTLTHRLKDYAFLMLYGFHLFYIACYALYLFYLIPIPGKNQSMKERMVDLKEFTKLLSDKFDSYQFKSSTVIVSASVVAILLYINFSYNLFSISNTILLTLTVGALVHRWN